MAKQNAETTKAVETTTKSTPVNDRSYKLIAAPSITPKGKQRQIVLAAFGDGKKPMTVNEVVQFAEAKGLSAVGGVTPSVRYHLHQMALLKIVEVINPTVVIEKKAPAEKAA